MSLRDILRGSVGCLEPKKRLFIAITVVVMIIAIILSPNTATAVALVLAIAAFALIAVHCWSNKGEDAKETLVSGPTGRLAQTGFDSELLPAAPGGPCKSSGSFCPNGKKEGFLGVGGPLPGPHAPYPVATPVVEATGTEPDANWVGNGLRDDSTGAAVLNSPRGYPGGFEDMEDFSTDSTGGPQFYGPAIDSTNNTFDVDSDVAMSSVDPGADDAWALGHTDRLEGDYDTAPEGNPFDLARTAAPLAAGPCVDDEANDDELDGDEGMTLQGLSRNDPTRVEAGIFNRLRDLKPYLDEETAEAENKIWWGAHEV